MNRGCMPLFTARRAFGATLFLRSFLIHFLYTFCTFAIKKTVPSRRHPSTIALIRENTCQKEGYAATAHTHKQALKQG